MKSSLPIFAIFAAGAVVAVFVTPVAAQLPNVGNRPKASTAASPSTAPPRTAQLPARQAPPATRQPEAISGDALLRRVITAIDSVPSIAAKVRYRVDLKGESTVGAGVYMQQGRGPERMMVYDLSLPTGETTSRVRHIADRSTLWIVEELVGANNYGRVDLARLRRARPKSQAGVPSDGWLALGGLPKLISGLDRAFQFGPVTEGKLDEVRVWTLRGEWERDRLMNLLPNQKDAIAAGQPFGRSQLSPQLPDTVIVHVGCDDFFPYRIEYWRSPEAQKKSDDEEPVEKLLVVMELYEVRLGGPIDADQFAFQPPPEIKPADRTVEYLDKLGLEELVPPGANRKGQPRR
jgi:hypothetical protein